ncbi:A/G-specific adenine glycosylase [Paenibacillus sp. YYML68]|uniref:A/G-specific adenine glycosylase n=1 Tax=Paenibacillus sp. YYML68 TaxID=2909250 RepID=UPI00248FDE8E|nr:A/G-specific adenine glycosylase [Paenibacillus sp. YYML68]
MEATEAKRYFSTELLSWYRRHKRDLPWRRHRNAYYTWVSEIMLQQTRVDTVIPYFNRFIEQFPTVQALAEAPEEEVLKAWEGLGYYSRARNLQSAVREVHESYGGVVPDSKEAVSALKGVGPYTTGAILSIAYNKPEPAVDGNVMRVLSRYFRIEDDIAKPRTRVRMEVLAQELIPEGAAGDFNQGLMELGALVCTPKSPHCLTCPVMAHCAGRAAGVEETLPVKTKAKPPRPEARAAIILQGSSSEAGKVLIRQRPSTGLLARMWELPHTELSSASAGAGAAALPAAHAALSAHLAEQGFALEAPRWLLQTEHTFSHIHWQMDVLLGSLDVSVSGYGATDRLPSHYRWISREEMADFAFPNVFLRILNAYFDQHA